MYIIKPFNAHAKVLLYFIDVPVVIALTSVSAVDGTWRGMEFRGKQNFLFPMSF